ncbi:MAG: hypothetical protein IJF83_06115 [Methanobrevibacter sp.]|nr:hypothetical protein [Methanobrevibacter sp.]
MWSGGDYLKSSYLNHTNVTHTACKEYSYNGDYSFKIVSNTNEVNYVYFTLPALENRTYVVKGIMNNIDSDAWVTLRARLTEANINNQVVLGVVHIPIVITNFTLTGTVPSDYGAIIVLFNLSSETTVYIDNLEVIIQ